MYKRQDVHRAAGLSQRDGRKAISVNCAAVEVKSTAVDVDVKLVTVAIISALISERPIAIAVAHRQGRTIVYCDPIAYKSTTLHAIIKFQREPVEAEAHIARDCDIPPYDHIVGEVVIAVR